MFKLPRHNRVEPPPNNANSSTTTATTPSSSSPPPPATATTTPSHTSADVTTTTSAVRQASEPAPTGATPRAMTEGESLARSITEGKLRGFIGVGMHLQGEVTFKALLRIDGRFTGHIKSDEGTLMVGAGGEVEGQIDVAVAIINGNVVGDIVAGKRIELGRAAKVIGDITTPALVVEQGAVFEGRCQMVGVKETEQELPPSPSQQQQPSVAAFAARPVATPKSST